MRSVEIQRSASFWDTIKHYCGCEDAYRKRLEAVLRKFPGNLDEFNRSAIVFEATIRLRNNARPQDVVIKLESYRELSVRLLNLHQLKQGLSSFDLTKRLQECETRLLQLNIVVRAVCRIAALVFRWVLGVSAMESRFAALHGQIQTALTAHPLSSETRTSLTDRMVCSFRLEDIPYISKNNVLEVHRFSDDQGWFALVSLEIIDGDAVQQNFMMVKQGIGALVIEDIAATEERMFLMMFRIAFEELHYSDHIQSVVCNSNRFNLESLGFVQADAGGFVFPRTQLSFSPSFAADQRPWKARIEAKPILGQCRIFS